MTIRKVAANRVYLSDSEYYTNHVVEIFDNMVINHYPLMAEQPQTEWLGGTVIIKNQRTYHTKKVLSPEEAKTGNIHLNDIVEL